MPKNKIQFQRGLSLPEFLASYGTETKCRESLFRLRWPNGFVCPECGHTAIGEIKTRNLFQCKRCHRQSAVICGTIFASTKLPLTTWFLDISLIIQSKDGISSLNLSRSLGISANAALRMKHKLQQVMKEEPMIPCRYPVSSSVMTHIGVVVSVTANEGRGASGKVPFLAAVSTNLKGNPVFMRFSRIGFTKDEVTQWSKKHLKQDRIVVSDGLGCFSGIDDAGCDYETIISSGKKAEENRRHFKWVNTVIGNVKKSIHGTYHAISPKQLPQYLAEFCYRFNRRFHLDRMIKQLVWAAVRTHPIPQPALSRAEDWW